MECIVIIIKKSAYFTIIFAEKFIRLKLPWLGTEKLDWLFLIHSLNSGHYVIMITVGWFFLS